MKRKVKRNRKKNKLLIFSIIFIISIILSLRFQMSTISSDQINHERLMISPQPVKVTNIPEPTRAIAVNETPVIKEVSIQFSKEIMETRDIEVINITNDIGPMYNIDPELLQAIAFYESSNDPYATNPSGDCFGLMQISYRWHEDRMNDLGITDINDPYGNILLGADYISELIEQEGDISLALMIYNGDSRAYDLHNQGDMSDYARNILELRDQLNK